MTHKMFFKVTSTIFLIIGVVHALRIIYSWPAVVSGWSVPMWLSWLAVVIAGYLSYTGFRFGK